MVPMPARLRWSSSASPSGAVGVGEQPAHGLLLVPVGAEQVGAEVADDVVLPVARHQLDDAEREADRRPRSPVSSTTRAWWPGLAPALAGLRRPARSPPSSGGCAGSTARVGASMRVSRCLPRETVSTTVPPARSAVAMLRAPGSRCAVEQSCPIGPGRAAGRCARRCRPQAPVGPQPQPPRGGDEPGGLERLAQRGRARRRAAARRRPSRR